MDGLQPAVAIHYVLALGKHLESVDETRVMPLLLQHHVVKSLILHVTKNSKLLPVSALLLPMFPRHLASHIP